MAGGASKRSSEDCVFTDNKKKKVSREKHNAGVPNEKTAPACDKDLRQKKAFFAYFGKSFVDDNNKHANSDISTNKIEINAKNRVSSDKNVDDDIEICVKKIIDNKHNEPTLANHQLIKTNVNLPHVSCFIEEFGYFPKFSHVNRLAPLSCSELKLHLNNEETLKCTNYKYDLFSFQTSDSLSKRLVLKPYQIHVNLPYMFITLKENIKDFPVSHFYEHMKRKIQMVNKSDINTDCMWIEKYKPTIKKEVIGNTELLKSLKAWLEHKNKICHKSKKGKKYDDDDDYVFDNDSDSNHKVQHNLAILLGPSGCGKTTAVYAIANELDANVIELNASCNRNGKRIISDLMEATQSHAVKKNCLLNTIKEKKRKKKKQQKNSNPKMTILLIEDADILFENYDEGFISAISTLATDSKRPLVLIANDPYSSNLLKFMLSSKITLNFIYPPREHLNLFLKLMALNEGAILSDDEINTFINPIKPDIRQSIIQLQYVLSTGEIDHKSQNNNVKRNINSIWWNWPYAIGCDSHSIRNMKQSHYNIDIATISKNLDSMSSLNLIYSKIQGNNRLDAQPFWNDIAIRDSASLMETHYWSDNSIQLSTEITKWLHDNIHTKDYDNNKFYPLIGNLNCRQRTWDISKNILKEIGLNYSNRKNDTCFDYLSTIKSMGENQQLNNSIGNLRNSKMFSYLRRIDINIDGDDLKYLCNSMFPSFNCDLPPKISDQF